MIIRVQTGETPEEEKGFWVYLVAMQRTKN
jgi:hypothetical protein